MGAEILTNRRYVHCTDPSADQFWMHWTFKDLVKSLTPHLLWQILEGASNSAIFYADSRTAEIVANKVTQESYQIKNWKKTDFIQNITKTYDYWLLSSSIIDQLRNKVIKWRSLLSYENTVLWCSRCKIHRYVAAPGWPKLKRMARSICRLTVVTVLLDRQSKQIIYAVTNSPHPPPPPPVSNFKSHALPNTDDLVLCLWRVVSALLFCIVRSIHILVSSNRRHLFVSPCLSLFFLCVAGSRLTGEGVGDKGPNKTTAKKLWATSVYMFPLCLHPTPTLISWPCHVWSWLMM